MKGPLWTTDEVQTLRQLYPLSPAKCVAKFLNRSPHEAPA